MRQISLLISTIALIMLIGCASVNFIDIPVPSDDNFLFDTGTAKSRKLQIALDKATLNARTGIASQLEIKLNNLQKNFAEEIGESTDSELNTLYMSATKSVVSQVLVGSKVKEKKYREKDGVYEARVLVELPIGEAHSALINHLKNNQQNLYTRFRAAEGFKELEAEVEKFEKFKKEQRGY